MPDFATVAWAFAIAAAPAAVAFVILNAIDIYEKEPWMILLACLGLGAIAAPILSSTVLAALGRPFQLPVEYAGEIRADPLVRIIQELSKGVLLLGLIRWVRDEFDDLLDGVIYGAALGAGFAAAEVFLFAAAGPTLLSAGTIAIVVAAAFNHVLYGAVLGGLIGYGRNLSRPAQTWIVIGLGMATAALLSAFHDALPNIIARLVGQPGEVASLFTRAMVALLNVLGLLALLAVVIASWRRQARIVRTQLQDEVATGLISKTDLETIASVPRRLGRQLGAIRTAGLTEALTLRRRYELEGELAFHKWRQLVRSGRRPSDTRGDELRKRIRSLGSGASGESNQ